MLSRIAIFLLFAPLSAPVIGCNPSQREIENSIDDEMKSKLKLDIQSFDLKKQDDGSYKGTCTATNGDVYEITTEKPSGAAVKWRALPTQAVLERDVRAGIEEKYNLKVNAFNLARIDETNYEGFAEFSPRLSAKVKVVFEGSKYRWEMESIVRDRVARQ